MSLTSVVPSVFTQQQKQLTASVQSAALNASPYSAFHSINTPQANQLGIFSPAEGTTTSLLVTTNHGATPSTILQNGYFPASTMEPYRLIPHPINTLLRAYHTFQPAIQTDGHSHMSTVSNPCLLPTPLQPTMSPSPDSIAQAIGMHTGRKTQTDFNSDQTCAMDDNTNMKLAPSVLETFLANPQTAFLVVRLLMSGKEVGSIIGKRGENVKKYREESGAKINISDGSSPERIVTVTGTTEQIFVAFTLMCRKFEDDFTQGLLRMGDEGLTCPPVTLRLLVPATQCGSIIGKGGSRIKDVRELTGASIQVASETLPTSTERTVTISGTAKAIAKCIRHLCEIFIESPIKGPVIPYRPKPAYANQAVLYSTTPFSPRIMHPNFTYSTPTISEPTATEHSFQVNGFSPGLTFNSTNPHPNNITDTSTTTSPIGSTYVGALGINTDVNSIVTHSFSADGDNHSTGNILHPGRTPTILGDLLTDSVPMSPTIAYSDFPNYQWPILNSVNPAPIGSSILPGSVLNPLSSAFVMPPEVAFNPTLFYTPHAIGNIGQANNFIYAAIPSLLRPINPCSKETSTVAHTMIDNGVDSAEHQSDSSDKTDICANGSVISASQTNSYSNPKTFMNPLCTSSVPLVQNKASLLGLPAVPLTKSTNGLPLGNGIHLSSFDDTVMKEMIISNELIGCIIGRGGTTVNEIRNISKAQIKISSCEDGAKERKITLTGSLQSVNLAHFLITNSIAAHQQNWAFNVQLASALTTLMTASRHRAKLPSLQSSVSDELEPDDPANDRTRSSSTNRHLAKIVCSPKSLRFAEYTGLQALKKDEANKHNPPKKKIKLHMDHVSERISYDKQQI